MFDFDYLDEDVSYLLGMLLARGELLSSGGDYRIIIHFPRGALQAEGSTGVFDADTEIRLGIESIRERMLDLLGGDIRTVDAGDSWDLIVQLARRTIAWRDIQMLLGNKTSYRYFQIPPIFFDSATPTEFKKELIKGYADVAGNIRKSNRDQAGRHRVRLDTLNHKTSWNTPVQLCLLLQDHLTVAVPNITWGHPNLGRDFREHQLNVYAESFLDIGFYFKHKQRALEELALLNSNLPSATPKGCPGERKVGRVKPPSKLEDDERLPEELFEKHFDTYWQICRALNCTRRPVHVDQLEMDMSEDEPIQS